MGFSVLLSLAVIVLIGYFTFDPAAFRRLPQHFNPWWLVAAVATVGTRVLFGGWRLDYFAHGRLGLRGGMRSQVAWDFFAYITPSTIGGGPFVSAFIARKHRLPLGDATSIVLFAMLLDQIWFALTVPVLLAGSFFLDVIPEKAGALGFWSFTAFFVGFMAWVLLFAYGTLFRPQLLERLVDRVFRLRPLRAHRRRAQVFMEDLRHRSAILRRQPAAFYAKGFGLTIVPWLSRYLLVLFLLLSVYPAVDVVLALLRTVVLHDSAVVLPTPGGAGGLEGLYALLLGPPLVPEGLVAPTLLAWRVLGFYLFIAAGAAILMHGMQRKLRRRAAAPADTPEEAPEEAASDAR